MAQHSVNEAPVAGNPSPAPFSFKDHEIRTIVNGDGKPWFVARDTAKALGIGWSGHTLDNIPTDWRGVVKLTTRQKNGRMVQQGTAIISEPAVYKLAFRSNKVEADEFTNWVASEVLPTIRKTGCFEAATPTGPITPDQQQHIRNLVAARAKALPHGAGFPQIWERVKNHFGVARYQDIPAEQFEAVVEYLLKMELKVSQPKALPGPDEDLRTAMVAHHRAYRPELRTVEDAVMAACAQLRIIEDAVARAAHAADGSNITMDTSLAQKSYEMVVGRSETIRHELRELESLAVLGFAGIAVHLELKHARNDLRQIEKDSKGRFKSERLQRSPW